MRRFVWGVVCVAAVVGVALGALAKDILVTAGFGAVYGVAISRVLQP